VIADLVRPDALNKMAESAPRTVIHAQNEGVTVTLEIVADPENGNNRAIAVKNRTTMPRLKRKLVFWAV